MRHAVGCSVLVTAALLVGCAPADSTAPAPGAQELSGDLVVFAAASLTGTFTEIGDLFTAEHPDVTVTFSFGGSSGLAQQIVSGAPADVFAAASPAAMWTVVDADGAASDPQTFATNTLEIVVPAGNPGGIAGLADFTDEAKKIALCAVEVPCGAASGKVFETAGLTPAPDTLERDVRAVLTKVQLGEVDAGLVYRTDVIAAGDAVEGIELPEAGSAVNDYPIALLAESPNPEVATAFIELVLGEGQAILSAAGFSAP